MGRRLIVLVGRHRRRSACGLACSRARADARSLGSREKSSSALRREQGSAFPPLPAFVVEQGNHRLHDCPHGAACRFSWATILGHWLALQARASCRSSSPAALMGLGLMTPLTTCCHGHHGAGGGMSSGLPASVIDHHGRGPNGGRTSGWSPSLQYLRVVGVGGGRLAGGQDVWRQAAAHGPSAIVWFPAGSPGCRWPRRSRSAILWAGSFARPALRISRRRLPWCRWVGGAVLTHLGWMTIELAGLAAGRRS